MTYKTVHEALQAKQFREKVYNNLIFKIFKVLKPYVIKDSITYCACYTCQVIGGKYE